MKKIIKKTDENGQNPKKSQLAISRAALVQSLAKARSAKERLDMIISAEKCEALVPTLHAEDLYFTIKEVGMSDSVELVRLASPDQFRTFVDLDAWHRDNFAPKVALEWLRAAATDENEQHFRKKIFNLDIELLEAVLRSAVIVHDLGENENADPEGPTFRSPEGRYLIEFIVEGTEYLGVRKLLDELYADDPFKAARLLEAIRWETPSELEETAYRWRSARLEDLGFPELSEALSYFAFTDPDAALPSMDAAPHLPGSLFLSRAVPGTRFLDRAMALVPEDDREIVERQLITLLNAVMVVEGVDPGESAQVEKALELARDTLSLGLEHVSGGVLELGAGHLAAAPMKRIFQIGVSLALRLKFRADRLVRSLAQQPGSNDVANGAKTSVLPRPRNGLTFDSPIREVFAALRKKRPLFAKALDIDGQDGSVLSGAMETYLSQSTQEMRPFRDKKDLARVTSILDDAEKLLALLRNMGLEAATAAQKLALAVSRDSNETYLSDLFLTALIRSAVGESFEVAPVPECKLQQFAASVFVVNNGIATISNQFANNASEKIEQASSQLSEEHLRVGKAFVKYSLARLLEEAGAPYAATGLLPGVSALPFAVG